MILYLLSIIEMIYIYVIFYKSSFIITWAFVFNFIYSFISMIEIGKENNNERKIMTRKSENESKWDIYM